MLESNGAYTAKRHCLLLINRGETKALPRSKHKTHTQTAFFYSFPLFFCCREKCLFSVVIIPKRAKPFFFTLPPGSSLFIRMYVCLVQKEGPDSCRLLYGRNSRGDFITRREKKKTAREGTSKRKRTRGRVARGLSDSRREELAGFLSF